jgi:hypothetical protein
MQFAKKFELDKYNPEDPNPWLALYLDRSIQMDNDAKAALLTCMSSFSRAFVLPVARPLARLAIIFIHALNYLIPSRFTSSKILHRLICWGLKNFVSPEANFLILRHFHVGSEILAFIASNIPGVEVQTDPIRPRTLDDVKDHIFLRHDLNLYNFVIRLNTKLRDKDISIRPPDALNFDCITDGPFELNAFPKRWTNFIDVQSAIEIYTPLYQLFLSENDFWRAANSLQLDETIGLYVARILNAPEYIGLVNNKHPMVPLSTMGVGFRLMLHGLASESLHAILREYKTLGRIVEPDQPVHAEWPGAQVSETHQG